MRLIGHLPDEQHAAAFSDYLLVQGVANEVEADRDGWAVWIHSEDELERATERLSAFQANPQAPEYRQHGRQAQTIRTQQQQEAEAAAKRHFDRRRLFPRTGTYRASPLTFSLIALCIVVGVLSRLGENGEVLQYLLLSIYKQGLPEIMHGQVWRLFTPVLVHFGILHLAFNMLWLFDLGGMIESRTGTRRLALLVLSLGVVPNVAQFFVSGPMFGGMSGVVYGLLGYVWMKGRFDPGSGLYLHPQTVTLMLIWFFLCLSGLIGNIANTVHGVGLGMGVAWGYASSQLATRRR